MATNRIIPPPAEQPSPQLVHDDDAAAGNAELEQRRETRFRNTLRVGAVADLILGIIAVLVVCYLAKIVLVTLLVSVLIAFTLEPLVTLLQRWRLPRSGAALIAVLLLCGLVWAGSYFFYNRAVSFAHELPRYSQKIRGKLARITKQTSDIKQTTQQILPGEAQKNKNAVPVKVESSGSSEFFTKGLGTVTEVLAAVAFIPFLVYFMLSWQEHARTKTVQLFRPENRTTAYVTLGQISLMIRSFIAGNFIIGLFMSAVSTAVFGFLGLPYFYFLGLLSGFLSLMPYLGVVLAAVPPLAAGLGSLNESGVIIVVLTVLGLHLFSMNVLYPKVIGKRLQLNPLLVTISLLVWGWIWGALGLILAVPVMGVVKIVCDHVTALRPFGEWMGD
jgi:predicted PurR-regulated permease PerM